VTPLTPEAFRAITNVSRETLDRLGVYAETLLKWQERLNLIGPDTRKDLWRRHFLDSAQLYPLLPAGCGTLVDLGSGAGFPGLVLAAMGVPEIHLVESDRRKSVFLNEAARRMEISVTVHAARIESLPPWPNDAVTARACARLDRLIDYAAPFMAPAGVALFPKGRGVEEELTLAGERWTMTVERFPSLTDLSGVILRMKGVSRGACG